MPDKRSQQAKDRRKILQYIKFIHYRVRDLLSLNAAPACFADCDATLAVFETARLELEDKPQPAATPIVADELPYTQPPRGSPEPSAGYQPY